MVQPREKDKAKCSPLLYGSVSAGPTGGDPGTLDTAEGQRAREGGTEGGRERGREGETDNSFPIFTSGTAHCDTCVNMHEN